MTSSPDPWKRGGESVLVDFNLNPQQVTEELTAVGTAVLERFHSRYRGFCRDRSTTNKVVFPWNTLVEKALDALSQQGRGPWAVPCFIEERETICAAYAVDYQKLEKMLDKPLGADQLLQLFILQYHSLEERLSAEVRRRAELERQMGDLADLVGWIKARNRRLAIVVDWPNYSKVVKAESLRLPPEKTVLLGAVEALRWFGRLSWPREIVQVVIVDYYHPDHVDAYRTWEAQGYTFVRAPEDATGVNTTDRTVEEQALALAARRQELQLTDVCLVTGDVDFTPLCCRLQQEYGLYVFVAGFIGHLSRLLLQTVPVVYLDLIVPLPPPEFWEMVEAPRTLPGDNPSST